MVVDVALYTRVHQPRRLKLPAQPIPRCASIEDMTRCLFDERLNEQYFRQVARSCYYPSARMFLDLVRQQGLRMAIGFSLSFVRQAERWEPALLDLFRELTAEESVEVIGVEPYHSLHCLLDLPAFTMRMRWMAEEIERICGKRPTLVDATDLCLSASIYDALDTAGFRGVLIEGSPRVMQWRSSGYLYHYSDEQACVEIRMPTRARRSVAKISERDRLGPPYTAETLSESGPYLLARHQELSADVEVRFSNRNWSNYPLYADSYARWIERAEGDFILLGWNFETFGERHAHASGIFEFMQALPKEWERAGVASRTPGELIDRFAGDRTYPLPLPVHPTTWSDAPGLGTYFDREPQQALFQLMLDVYNRARLTENPELLDLAIWLAQSDNFSFVQWPGPQIVTSITPYAWWRLGPHGILREQRQVYLNALEALAPYLPARILRSARQKPAAKSTRRKSIDEEQELGVMARLH
jgi:alpha-amylase